MSICRLHANCSHAFYSPFVAACFERSHEFFLCFHWVQWSKFLINLVKLSSDDLWIKWNIQSWWFREDRILWVVNTSFVSHCAIGHFRWPTSPISKSWGSSCSIFVVIFTYITINLFWSFTKYLFKEKWKFGGKLFETKLLPRLSQKVCRLLSSSVLYFACQDRDCEHAMLKITKLSFPW